MSVRAIWILTPTPTHTENHWQMLYARRYTVIEKRARTLLRERYRPIPRDNKIIVDSIVCALGLDQKTSDIFMENRDACDKVIRSPVIEVFIDENVNLWPVVVADHYGHLLCCLPLIEDEASSSSSSIESLIELDSVSTAFSVLMGIQSVLGSGVQKSSQLVDKLEKYLSFSMPLGRPGELDPNLVHSALTTSPSPSEVKQNIIPVATKSHVASVKVTEFIRGIQYNNPDVKNVIDVYGNVKWSGVLTPSYNEVTLSLTSVNKINLLPLQLVAVHPCVYNVDQLDSLISKITTGKLRFKPATNSIALCYYDVKMKSFPILGNYKMSYTGNRAELSVQLTLNEDVKNNFVKCEVRIPFSRQKIAKYELKPSWGSVAASKDAKNVIWTFRDNKFPTHNSEVTLKGSVYLTSTLASKEEISEFVSDAFVSINFEIDDFTLSGYLVDQKSIHTSSPTTVKITSKTQLLSTDYKIWNKNGDPPVQFIQKIVSEPTTPLLQAKFT